MCGHNLDLMPSSSSSWSWTRWKWAPRRVEVEPADHSLACSSSAWLSGVMQPLPYISYILNASLHLFSSSSWPASASRTSLRNSSSSSPSLSAEAIRACTSSADMSPPSAAYMQSHNSAVEILPSPSYERREHTAELAWCGHAHSLGWDRSWFPAGWHGVLLCWYL